MSFPRYPKYKDSGVEWLGQVPEHWEVRRFHRCVAIAEGQVDPNDAAYSQMPLIAPNHIESGTGRLCGIESAADQSAESGKYLCRAGDVVYSKIRPALRKVCIAPVDCLCSADMYPLRPHSGLNEGYLFWTILTEYFSAFAVLESDRVAMPKINRESLKHLVVPFPPNAEQVVVSSFLDRETAKIDALIAEQQRLIELLQEKRQAVISHAVTKGLNPDAPMKDSGIEWLGKVPEHWKIPPVFARYEAVLGKMVDEKKATGAHPVPYLRNADVYWDQINTNDLPTLDIQPHERARFTVQRGDVLICEGGAGIGQTAIWHHDDGTTAFQKALHRLRPWNTTKEHPRYFFYCMRFVVESGILLAGGTATIPHLTGEQLRRYRFPCPPLPEQQAIVEYLDGVAQGMNSLHQQADIAITLLKERRSALISAAVTGQIDVRGLVGSEAA